ncbi:hypothetical protein JTB14_015351 [Gonioctena quinquepunctata]|nr:hypothetical protein JTB14_015351 [Gonioctena quinquepunctata]
MLAWENEAVGSLYNPRSLAPALVLRLAKARRREPVGVYFTSGGSSNQRVLHSHTLWLAHLHEVKSGNEMRQSIMVTHVMRPYPAKGWGNGQGRRPGSPDR